MKARLILSLMVIAVSCCGKGVLTAQKEAKPFEVKEKLFQVVETVDARVEAAEMYPVTPDTKNWTNLKILSIVEEGSLVAKGDVIASFDTEEIDRKLTEAAQSVELARLSLQSSEAELKQLDRTMSLDIALAERKIRNAEQDYKYFVEVERPNTEKTTRRGVENAQHSLEYASEEYNQLKRMYDEDELTEESEEIVLKRTQRDVENSQFYLEQAQMRAGRALEYDLPRTLEQKTDELERARLESERTQVSLPVEREKKVIAFDKARFEFEKESADLEKLREDRSRMTLHAPVDGIVYYGRCQRGNWTGPQGPQRDIEVGRAVAHDKPLVTVVTTDALFLRTDLTEAQLAKIAKGARGTAVAAAFPNQPVPAEVTAVGHVPFLADKFDCQMSLVSPVPGLMPGMTCKVRFLVHENPKALVVPEANVFTDDGMTHFVFVETAPANAEAKTEAKYEKRVVEIGLTSDKNTEILSGLKSGEKISDRRH